jgi:CHAT domain-containing protein
VPSASGWLSIKRLAKKPSAKEPLMAWGDPQFALTNTAATSGGVRALANQRVLQARSLQNGTTDAMVYSRIPPLPETRDEVLNLAKILSANPSSDLLLGAQATRRSVLEANQKKTLLNKRVLVFATHGLLAGDLPNVTQPALAMASTGSEQDSPLLTLEDVLTLNINADWVVLSACNTAGADGRAKEAMSGLARGFFYAGSRSLLVTHWSVESESAMFLTTRTFAAYQADSKIRRSEALRQSMLETMKTPKFSHPAYWAPYALVGEGGR